MDRAQHEETRPFMTQQWGKDDPTPRAVDVVPSRVARSESRYTVSPVYSPRERRVITPMDVLADTLMSTPASHDRSWRRTGKSISKLRRWRAFVQLPPTCGVSRPSNTATAARLSVSIDLIASKRWK
jgi:hypothetical protein